MDRALCLIRQGEKYYFSKRTKDPFNGKWDAFTCKSESSILPSRIKEEILSHIYFNFTTEKLIYEGQLNSKEGGQFHTIHLFSYDIPEEENVLLSDCSKEFKLKELAGLDLLPDIPIFLVKFFRGQPGNYFIDWNENNEMDEFSYHQQEAI
jgi:hypothetical protein